MRTFLAALGRAERDFEANRNDYLDLLQISLRTDVEHLAAFRTETNQLSRDNVSGSQCFNGLGVVTPGNATVTTIRI